MMRRAGFIPRRPATGTDGRYTPLTSQIFSYNSRHLVAGITYSALSGSGITVPAAALQLRQRGNRTSMSDGSGGATYHFDELSRMDWEERTFTGGLAGTYRMSYVTTLQGN